MREMLEELKRLFGWFDDEPRERADSVHRARWPHFVWPRAEQYRIVDHGLEGAHRFGLEAYYEGQWVSVLCYDCGCDQFGKLHAAKWVPLRTECRWSIQGLKGLQNELTGQPQAVAVVG